MSIKCIDSSTTFIITFVNAQSIKQLVEYLRLCGDMGDFYLNEEMIRFECLNSTSRIYNNALIDASFLTEYKISFGDESEKVDYIYMRLDLDKLRDIIKGTKKKDSMVMYKMRDDNRVYIKVHNSGHGTKNTSWISPIYVTENIVPIGDFEYENDLSKPNCTIPMSEFCTVCSDLKSMGVSSTLTVYKEGFKIVSNEFTTNNDCGTFIKFGNIDDSKHLLETDSDLNKVIKSFDNEYHISDSTDEIISLDIKSEMNGYLSKLNGIFPDGIIRIFAEPFMPILLICSIGDFGLLRTHIIPEDFSPF